MERVLWICVMMGMIGAIAQDDVLSCDQSLSNALIAPGEGVKIRCSNGILWRETHISFSVNSLDGGADSVEAFLGSGLQCLLSSTIPRNPSRVLRASHCHGADCAQTKTLNAYMKTTRKGPIDLCLVIRCSALATAPCVIDAKLDVQYSEMAPGTKDEDLLKAVADVDNNKKTEEDPDSSNSTFTALVVVFVLFVLIVFTLIFSVILSGREPAAEPILSFQQRNRNDSIPKPNPQTSSPQRPIASQAPYLHRTPPAFMNSNSLNSLRSFPSILTNHDSGSIRANQH